MERDEASVKYLQDKHVELEFAQTDALYFKQEWANIESRLQSLNDRLISLVQKRRGG
jgi:hypothetical protein